MPSTAQSARYQSLDLWRGVACLSVIVYHSTLYTEGRLSTIGALGQHGVTIFFVISGYCIAAAADRAGCVRQYFVRRLRRIFPPYWAVLALTGALSVVLSVFALDGLLSTPVPPHRPLSDIPSPSALSWSQWLGTLTLIEAWRPWLGGDATRWLVGHAWTLAYEEQFYAVFGILVWLTPRRQARAVSLISAGVLALPYAVVLTGIPFPTGFFFDGAWLLFAAGTAVFYMRESPPARVAATMAALTLITAVLAPWLRVELLIAGTFAVILIALRPHDGRIMAWPLTPLYACGVRCYSVYLVHWPITKLLSHGIAALGLAGPGATLFITIPVCIAGSLIAAWRFHASIERRFLNVRSAPIPNAGRSPHGLPPSPPPFSLRAADRQS
jgi:peptidoglycan/LPS O-acetylase OafA/YrhL